MVNGCACKARGRAASGEPRMIAEALVLRHLDLYAGPTGSRRPCTHSLTVRARAVGVQIGRGRCATNLRACHLRHVRAANTGAMIARHLTVCAESLRIPPT